MDNKWKKERMQGIGGSDAAAILGLSPWKSQMDVWVEKMGMKDEETDPNRQFLLDLGNDLEPVISKLYERQTKRSLYMPSPKRIVHSEQKFLAGSPDRLVAGEARGVELKSENQFMDQFGEPGTDQVPYHYLVQCAHYMAVMDFPVWDVALLHGGAAFSIYTIERDMELERDMIDQLRCWWEKHVVAKEPPDVDGSGAWKVYLRKKFPSDILPIKEADEQTITLVQNLATIQRIVDEYTGLEYQIKNELKLVIGEHEGIEGAFGKITWRKAKDRTVTDWESAFTQLAWYRGIPEEMIRDAVKANTVISPGSRRFLFKEREGWNHAERPGIQTSGQAAISENAGNGEHGAGSAGEGADRGALHHGGTPSA